MKVWGAVLAANNANPGNSGEAAKEVRVPWEKMP
jgi:hypothetical protein